MWGPHLRAEIGRAAFRDGIGRRCASPALRDVTVRSITRRLQCGRSGLGGRRMRHRPARPSSSLCRGRRAAGGSSGARGRCLGRDRLRCRRVARGSFGLPGLRGRRRSCRSRCGGRGRLVRRGRADRKRLGLGQKQERVEVALRVRAPANAEIHVRHRERRDSARADGSDRLALRHDRPSRDFEGAEVHERDGEAVLRLDRHRPPTRRNGPGEGDRPARGCEHRRSRRRADVDPAVLSCRVRIGSE